MHSSLLLGSICVAFVTLAACSDEQTTSQYGSGATSLNDAGSAAASINSSPASGLIIRTASSSISTSGYATPANSSNGVTTANNAVPANSAAAVTNTHVQSGVPQTSTTQTATLTRGTSQSSIATAQVAVPTVGTNQPSTTTASVATPAGGTSHSGTNTAQASTPATGPSLSSTPTQVPPATAATTPEDDYPSQTLTPTLAGAGWSTVALTDLIKNSKSNCVAESSSLISCAGPLQINSLTNTTVLGGGVEIQFTNPEAGRGGVILTSANGVVISNFTISWLGGGARDAIVPGVERIQSFGNVAACANQQTGGVLLLDLPVNGVQPLGSASVWDDNSGWPWYQSAPNAYEVDFPTGTTTSFSAGRSGCLPALTSLVGHRVLLRHIVFTNHAFHCLGCQNVTVQNVRITSAPGMGFVFENGGNHISLIDDFIGPKCAADCALPEPSTTADAAHFADITGSILLEGNDFGWQGDDGVNITGLLVPAQADLTTKPIGSWLDVDKTWSGRLYTMTVGSSVSIYDAGLNKLGDTHVVASVPSAGRVELAWLPNNLSNLIIARSDGMSRNVVIRNNRFHDNRARGILIGGSDALVANNSIERVTMEAILVPADTGEWFEGPGAQHVLINANTISDVNRFPAQRTYPSAISAGVSIATGFAGVAGAPIQDIVVSNNVFSQILTNGSNPVSVGLGVSSAQVQTN